MRWRKSSTEGTGPTRRILFATDVHGSERCFRKFINAGSLYKVDYLILGGDITGKLLVPIVKQPNGTYDSRYGDDTVSGTDEAGVAALKDGSAGSVTTTSSSRPTSSTTCKRTRPGGTRCSVRR